MILAKFVVLTSTMRVVSSGIEVEVWLELSLDLFTSGSVGGGVFGFGG